MGKMENAKNRLTSVLASNKDTAGITSDLCFSEWVRLLTEKEVVAYTYMVKHGSSQKVVERYQEFEELFNRF